MVSLDTYGGKRVLLGILSLVTCMLPVWTAGMNYSSLNATSRTLQIGDTLFSPNHYFELGIFPYNYSGSTFYHLSIRYAYPIERAVTWMANRSIPLTRAAVLQLHPTGSLELSDSAINIVKKDRILYTFTDYGDVNVSAQLLDTGNLVLINNGTYVWTSFNNSPPTDTLVPGQGMNFSRGYSLNSWQRSGNPAIANDTYSFGWDARGVLALWWTSPKPFLNWKGGSYIPAPDVYAAHTIQNVDKVYFHETMGHLYIDSNPPTAILSGGKDLINDTTLRRITIFPDGGLRILQYTINQPLNETLQLNESWKPVANWVVSDRPDSRSQCTTFGTCGQYSECVSLIDSLDPVTCQCPGQNNAATSTWFTPIDGINPANGCKPLFTEQVTCINDTITDAGNPGDMLVLNNTDMPWGGDYHNLTGNASVNCKQACKEDCHCAGAVYSAAEQMCWMKNGILLNIGYPTVALHGTDRTSYLRNQAVRDVPNPPAAKKDNKWVKILVPAVGIPGVLLIVVVIFCLCRNDKVRQRDRDCGSCFRRRRPAGPDVMVFQGPADGA